MDSDSDARLTDLEEDEGTFSYEEERQANIKQNAALLASLGLNTDTKRIAPSTASKKPVLSSAEERTRREVRIKAAALKRAVEPTRRSSRVAAKESEVKAEGSAASPSYPSSPVSRRPDPLPKKAAPVIPTGPAYDGSAPLPRQPRPSRATDGTLIFEGRWRGVFTPNVTPEEMFAGGAFAGAFFCDTHSHVLRQPLVAADDIAALPFSLPDAVALLNNPDPDGDLNRFRVRAGQSLAEWEKAGWIWAEDPRGWAQWYTRFWDGRRCEDDERQVRRWLKVAGPTGRFKRALLKKIHLSGGEAALADEDVGRVLRQCLWQWGYELTESEYRRAMEE